MYALIASITLNTSLVSSLFKISRQSEDPGFALTSLPSVFLNKQGTLAPLFFVSAINQLILLGLCFAYFGFLMGVLAYIVGLVIGFILDAILGRLKWFGVYAYPVLVLILTVVAFKQIP
jgi:hypothetical protein